MALTATEQTNLMNLVVSMFNAAPGKQYFDLISDFYEANGRSLHNTANWLAGTGAFQSLYPSFLTSQQFATAFLSTLGLEGNQAAVDYIVGQDNAGVNRGTIILQAEQLLLASNSATYAQAKELLLNRIEVATYYTVTKGLSDPDLSDLRDVLVGVTSDDATVLAAKAVIDAAATAGKSYELKAGPDTILGTTGNDMFYGTNATLNTFDSINGNAGMDTFFAVVANDAGGVIGYTLPTNLFVSNVETLNLEWNPDDSNDFLNANVSNWAGLTTMNVFNTGTNEDNNTNITTKGNATTVSVQGGGTVDIRDSATTDTLSTVSLNGTNGDIILYSDVLTTVNLSNYNGDSGTDGVWVNAAAGTRTLTVNLSNVTNAYIDDDTATTLALNVTGSTASSVDLYADVATTLNVAGDKALTIGVLSTPALTTINGSTDTGGITVTPQLGNGVTFTGGSGADKVTIGATTKAINMGAGNDTVVFTTAALGVGGTVNGGDGDADVIDISSANAATASATATFNTVVSNFERLKLGATVTGSNDVVNLTNLNGIKYVSSGGTQMGTAVEEVQWFDLSSADSTGGSILVGGVPVSVPSGASSSQVASAIAAASASIIAANPGIKSIVANGDDVTVTWFSTAGNVAPITLAQNVSGAAFGAPATTSQGVTQVTEQQTISNLDPDATGVITIGGVQVLVVAGETEAQTATRVANALNATPPAGVASAAVSGNNVVVTFTAAAGNAALLSVSDPDSVINPDPSVTETRAYVAPSGEVQTVQITSGTDSTGGSILVRGTRIDLAPNLSIDEVGGVIAGAVAAIAANDPNLAGIAYDTITNTLTFTYTAAAGNLGGSYSTIGDNASGVVFDGPYTTANGVNGTASGTLTLNNMATGGTFELTGSNFGGVTINVTGAAASTTDSINLMLTSNSTALVGGVINVANVETVAIVTNDTDTTPDGDFEHTLTLVDSAATTITVSGDAGLILTHAGTAVTSVDASGITVGGFGYTTAALTSAATIKGSATGTNTISWTAATKAVTYTGGSGVDYVYANNANNTISTGAGADWVELGTGNNTVDLGAGADYIYLSTGINSVTGGAGNDVFDVAAITANGVTFSTIMDAAAGDALDLFATGGSFAKVAGVVVDVAVYQDYLDAATAGAGGDVRWFQFGGNTYVVQDLSAETTFQNGADVVVRLAGLVDLSTAAWNGGAGVLTLA
jgi:S-layer protein